MTTVVVWLSVAYAVVAALLLNLNLATRHGRLVKVTTILLVTGLYVVAWHGHRDLLGWATPDDFPDEFRLHWITVDEPDKATGRDGAIFFWLRALDEAGLVASEPRAHRMPWDPETARAAEDAQKALEDGEVLNGRMSREQFTPMDEPVEQEAVYEGTPTFGDSGVRPRFEFVRAPPPSLPAKAP